MSTLEYYRAAAAKARRLADSIGDVRTREVLLATALEYEAKATALEISTIPSQGPTSEAQPAQQQQQIQPEKDEKNNP